MVNIIVCMFVADVVFVFFASVVWIILALYKLMTNQYKNMNVPATTSSGLRVKSKADGTVYDVYDTRHENGKVGFMIYKDSEFQWVTATEFEPATK